MSVNCGNENCESCFPKDDGIPKYKGCFTPDQVREMLVEMCKFLKDNNEPYAYIIIDHFCKNHPYKIATSGYFDKVPYEYYCEECWEKLHASF